MIYHLMSPRILGALRYVLGFRGLAGSVSTISASGNRCADLRSSSWLPLSIRTISMASSPRGAAKGQPRRLVRGLVLRGERRHLAGCHYVAARLCDAVDRCPAGTHVTQFPRKPDRHEGDERSTSVSQIGTIGGEVRVAYGHSVLGPICMPSILPRCFAGQKCCAAGQSILARRAD